MSSWNESGVRRIIVPLTCFILFTMGFEMGRRQAFSSSLRWGGILFQEARTLLEDGDDMGLVDWSKRLERDGVVAFRLTQDLAHAVGVPRVLAQGGNEHRIPSGNRGPISLLLPSTVLLVLKDRVREGSLELVLLLPSAPSPLAWGVFSLLIGFLCAGGGYFLRALEQKVPSKKGDSAMERPFPPIGSHVAPIPTQGQGSGGGLILDPGFKILEMDPGIFRMLRLSEQKAPPSHLLDLLPDPAFMEALTKGDLSEWRGAFPSAPDVFVTWGKVQEGRTLLELRPTDREGPKIL